MDYILDNKITNSYLHFVFN